MTKILILSAVMWPLILGVAVWGRQSGARPVWTAVVYAAASRICHQRPERSFHSGGVQWPVCARCAGLYLSAPIGAIVALGAVGFRRRRLDRAVMFVAIAALPTIVTVAIEWLGVAAVSNLMRATAAVPLGMAIAFVLIGVAAGTAKTDRVH